MQKLSPTKAVSWRALILAGLLLSAVLLAGCTAQPPSGQPAPSGVTNSAILSDPSRYAGRDLVLTGKIAIECSSGCWFLLDDGTGTIYVDLAENNFAIPQLQGSTATVKGVIRVENGDPKLFATNVTAGGRSYP